MSALPSTLAAPLRLHIGGTVPCPGWSIVNVQPGPHVDIVGDCTNLVQVPDASVSEIYGSHVYEHLGYFGELPRALKEAWRVLVPGGILRISVPDLHVLCWLFLSPELDPKERFHVMRVMFGGQMDAYDYHKVGLTWEFLLQFLQEAGFTSARRVSEFGLFDDCSTIRIRGHLISLNLEATK
jgi:predicted SAM-dependent methyltransferase